MLFEIIIALFVLAFIIFEIVLRPSIGVKRITKCIEEKGGTIISITKISMREEIYKVDYKVDNKNERLVAKVDWFFEVMWL
ncbi:MAG: hypothetical protein H7Y18_18120 [Clostridiaceae bacterium]|nr:hypothetical protein [Clostridiaceae bacterium]